MYRRYSLCRHVYCHVYIKIGTALRRAACRAPRGTSVARQQVALPATCRWRRVAAFARLFLPSVHCGTVTGAKMADNREEISELVEKRGIFRRLAPFRSPPRGRLAPPGPRASSRRASRRSIGTSRCTRSCTSSRRRTPCMPSAKAPRPRGEHVRKPGSRIESTYGLPGRFGKAGDATTRSHRPPATAVIVALAALSLIVGDVSASARLTVHDLALGRSVGRTDRRTDSHGLTARYRTIKISPAPPGLITH